MQTDRLPPLNSLKAFEAAARHESFLEAAAEQGVTPGSIGRHVTLFERVSGNRTVRPAKQRGRAHPGRKGIRREGRRHFAETREPRWTVSARPRPVPGPGARAAAAGALAATGAASLARRNER